MQSEQKASKKTTQDRIDELQAQLDAKNSYFDLYKTDLAKTKKAEEERARCQSTMEYDKVFQMYDEKIAGSTKYEHRTVQKPKKEPYNARVNNT